MEAERRTDPVEHNQHGSDTSASLYYPAQPNPYHQKPLSPGLVYTALRSFSSSSIFHIRFPPQQQSLHLDERRKSHRPPLSHTRRGQIQNVLTQTKRADRL